VWDLDSDAIISGAPLTYRSKCILPRTRAMTDIRCNLEENVNCLRMPTSNGRLWNGTDQSLFISTRQFYSVEYKRLLFRFLLFTFLNDLQIFTFLIPSITSQLSNVSEVLTTSGVLGLTSVGMNTSNFDVSSPGSSRSCQGDKIENKIRYVNIGKNCFNSSLDNIILHTVWWC